MNAPAVSTSDCISNISVHVSAAGASRARYPYRGNISWLANCAEQQRRKCYLPGRACMTSYLARVVVVVVVTVNS
jgi:hypothetical protein